MSREQIKEWADTCMKFVYNDLGYKKEQILHATDSNSKKVITNFVKYKNLLFISAKYMKLSLLEKQKFNRIII